jgi:hypothetical protein
MLMTFIMLPQSSVSKAVFQAYSVVKKCDSGFLFPILTSFKRMSWGWEG